MRKIVLLAAAMAAFGCQGAPASARDYPFCIKGENYDSPLGDCSFDTYQQCQASASGRLLYCDANPYYAAPTRPEIARKRARH